jgi:hypothetical protein
MCAPIHTIPVAPLPPSHCQQDSQYSDQARGVKVDEDIVIQAWKPSTRIPPLPGLQGHEPMPQKGDTVTVYVEGKKGKAFEPFLPNGMQIKEE